MFFVDAPAACWQYYQAPVFHFYLELHMHTAGKSFPGHVLYGISGQTIAVTPILHGLDKLTLKRESPVITGKNERTFYCTTLLPPCYHSNKLYLSLQVK